MLGRVRDLLKVGERDALRRQRLLGRLTDGQKSRTEPVALHAGATHDVPVGDEARKDGVAGGARESEPTADLGGGERLSRLVSEQVEDCDHALGWR